MVKVSTDTLKQNWQTAQQEYEFAFAAGDPVRLTQAIANVRRTWRAFDRRKRQEFNARNLRKPL